MERCGQVLQPILENLNSQRNFVKGYCTLIRLQKYLFVWIVSAYNQTSCTVKVRLILSWQRLLRNISLTFGPYFSNFRTSLRWYFEHKRQDLRQLMLNNMICFNAAETVFLTIRLQNRLNAKQPLYDLFSIWPALDFERGLCRDYLLNW